MGRWTFRIVVALTLSLVASLALGAQGVPVYTAIPTYPVLGGACTGTRVQVQGNTGARWCCVASAWTACETAATATVTGGIRLTGDLGGSATSPTVVDDSHAHTTTTISGLSTSDVTSGTLPVVRGGLGLTQAPVNGVLIGDDTQWITVQVPPCDTVSDKLLFNAASQTFSCGVDSTSETTPPGWTTVNASGGAAPAFNSPWVNIGGAEPPTRFKKNPDGVVYVQMAAQGGTLNSTIFTLPAGYRPGHTLYFKGESSTSDMLATIDSAGAVKVVATAGGTLERLNASFPADSPLPLVATTDHSSVSGSCITSNTSCTATTTTVTCAATGGSPPYSYAWSYVSGTTATVNSATSAATTFTRTGNTGLTQTTYSGVYRCTVTDSLSTADAAPDITVYTTHKYREVGG